MKPARKRPGRWETKHAVTWSGSGAVTVAFVGEPEQLTSLHFRHPAGEATAFLSPDEAIDLGTRMLSAGIAGRLALAVLDHPPP